MKRIKFWAAGAGSVLLLGLAGFLLVWGVGGVRWVHHNHVIATFAVHGLETPAERAEFKERLGQIHGYYHAAITRHLSSRTLWLARVQFKAASPHAAESEISRWVDTVPERFHTRPMLATFYPLRLERPAHGDLVFGRHVSILPRE